ncbi:TraR/DksA family transcriptional regulator [Nocardioides ferulae]|uniref:TraR/DksA family transcriptional regulator n=1 Tax=Nocardioides ferulae TaxID=2340821 RepID=UPI000EB34268|nr:TraR/DksA family transcriptional regulator [Nocardioides ferulae]
MARSTSKSLAGQAASAALRVIGRRRPAADQADAPDEPAEKTPAKKTPAKKAAAKKAPAKQTAAKQTAAKKTAAKKTAAKQTAAKKTAAKKTAAKKTAAKKAPAKKTAAKKTAAKKAAAKKTSAARAATSSRQEITPEQTKAAPVKASAKSTAKNTAPAADKAPSPTNGRSAGSASALVVKEGEEAWTKAELKEVLDELHGQREHSVAFLEQQEAELSGLMRDSGDGAGHDQADVGASSFERDHELSVLTSERDKIAQIDRALQRIENGSYGQCESCGQPIGKMRLMAFPRATLCMTCKQREERR